MDMSSETGFIEQISPIIANSTMLVVTHRMPLLKLVDRIIVMSDGKIIEDGPRDEIIKKLNG